VSLYQGCELVSGHVFRRADHLCIGLRHHFAARNDPGGPKLKLHTVDRAQGELYRKFPLASVTGEGARRSMFSVKN
jgi:hypothetical protein